MRQSRRQVIGDIAAWALGPCFAIPGFAEEVAFDSANFEALLARRGSLILAFVADWCTTCSRQKIVVQALIEDPRFRHLPVLLADHDKELALRQRYRVVTQGTFIAFRKGREVARSVGETSHEALEALFKKAL